MKELKDLKTRTYDAGHGYEVDIVTNDQNGTYKAYLYHKEYGNKIFMFGMPIEQQSYDVFLEIVAANVDDYIDDLEMLNNM